MVIIGGKSNFSKVKNYIKGRCPKGNPIIHESMQKQQLNAWQRIQTPFKRYWTFN